MTTGATAVALGDHLPRYNKKRKQVPKTGKLITIITESKELLI